MNFPLKYHVALAVLFVLGCAGQEQPVAPAAADGEAAGEVSSELGATPFTAAEVAWRSGRAANRLQTMLITAEVLAGQLDEQKLRIVDTRPAGEYQAGHIPGAVWVDVADWRQLALSSGGLHDARAWAEKVGALGIVQDSNVVVYGGIVSQTARVWWTLKYLGLADVQLLDGGWNAWKGEGRPTEKDKPSVIRTAFEPRFQQGRLAEIDDLKQWLGGQQVAVVDARSDAEYTGRQVRGARGGHIPGARHLDWTNLLRGDGRFKSPEQLREMFQKLGIAPSQTVVTYCQSGGRASAEAFALELAGFQRVRNYYCSWQEWSADEDAPVDKLQ